MPKFDWTTENDPAWNEGEWASEPSPPAPNRSSRWLMLALLALLLAAGGYLAVREVQGRVADAEEAVRAEISSSYSLLSKAAVERDSELLGSLLSGRDVVWAEVQRELVSDGMWLPAPFFAYSSSSPAADPVLSDNQLVSIELTPDLREAVVTSSFLVMTTAGDGSQAEVQLQRPELYRLGEVRWLLSNGDVTFWGESSAYRGEFITVRFPARDKTTAVRLGGDLDLLLGRMCQEVPDLNCPYPLSLELTLESDSRSLLQLRDELAAFKQGLAITLPTVSLLGTPIDERGYQLLFEAYARRVVSAVIAQQAGWRCCLHQQIFLALIDVQLSKFQLTQWPVTDQSYQWVVDDAEAIIRIGESWGSEVAGRLNEEDSWRLYDFIDWLTQSDTAISPQRMLRESAAGGTFSGWLSRASGIDMEGGEGHSVIQEANDQWQLYALQRIAAGQGEPPIGYPEQDLWLVCQQSPLSESSAVYKMQAANEIWSTAIENAEIPIFASALTGDDTFVISSLAIDNESEVQRFVVTMANQQGVSTLIDGSEIYLTMGQADPSSQYLVLIEAVQDGQIVVGSLLDYNACANGECGLVPLSGMPVWSADGEQSILMNSSSIFQLPMWGSDRLYIMGINQPRFDRPLYRGDSLGQPVDGGDAPVIVGIGSSPFWIDEQTYGYVGAQPLSSDSREVEVVAASIVDDIAAPLFSVADIRRLLNPDDRGIILSIRAVISAPNDMGMLFMLITADDRGSQYVISYDLDSGELVKRIESGIVPAVTIGFSPDGRWLTMATAASEGGRWSDSESLLYLNEVKGNRTLTIPANYSGFLSSGAYDWSADGEWLAVTSGRYAIKLIAPDHEFQSIQGNGGLFCSSLWWMDR